VVNGSGAGNVEEPAPTEIEAARARALIEESREAVVVLDGARNIVAASRRARSSIAGLRVGEPLPDGAARGRTPLEVRYAVGGREEALLYLSEPAENVAFEELRSGFTAAVSHELRTPLARLLALLESASLPGEDVASLIEQAREEVAHVGELIDDVLFLSELETGRQAVSLGSTAVLPVVTEAAARLADSADRAGVRIEVSGDLDALVPLRPRMLRVIIENLTSNAIRYAGPGATFTLTASRTGEAVVLDAADDGAGVDEADLPRLFERFYRPDRARSSRGTGLGLAIVKHVVTAAGGTVEADGRPGGGLRIRIVFPVR
jgi:two-component system, OmpR family, phosphate regulon sensor histidine kinase PhoR